jgi:hypothetical protein
MRGTNNVKKSTLKHEQHFSGRVIPVERLIENIFTNVQPYTTPYTSQFGEKFRLVTSYLQTFFFMNVQ